MKPNNSTIMLICCCRHSHTHTQHTKYTHRDCWMTINVSQIERETRTQPFVKRVRDQIWMYAAVKIHIANSKSACGLRPYLLCLVGFCSVVLCFVGFCFLLHLKRPHFFNNLSYAISLCNFSGISLLLLYTVHFELSFMT